MNESLDIGEMDIAIVGLAGRFPGAPDLATFWQNLRDGVESVQRFSDEALRAQGVPEALLADPAYVKAGVVLDGMALFDASYFGLAAGEAQRLDPQQRVFLETAAHALQHAGYDGPSRPVRTGVYAGSSANQYVWRQLLPAGALADEAALPALLNGNDKDALALRTAYALDLRGPAVSVQTACSTSLVAVHLACQALLNFEADLALAGGVSLNLAQGQGYLYQPGGIRSPDGHCRAFDAQAAGTLSGSGAGVVVLKRLAEALADGDTVHAVIKGSAINNDGAGKVGYTAPSVEGQARAIVAAQRVAGVSPASIGYVEAHGTGTPMGDPIELAALVQAFAANSEGQPARAAPCAIGSLKTNIGHLDAAAGVAGLIKTVLALRHATLPASLHFEQPNPQIDFAAGGFEVNARTRPWPAGATPRRAGVSSFGMGGTNAHVVLEEASPRPVQVARAEGWQLLPLSARSAAALQQAQAELDVCLAAPGAPAAADAAFTLQTGRRALAHRSVRLVPPGAAPDQGQWLAATQVGAQSPVLVFLFPGQGAQHLRMGRALHAQAPLFRSLVDQCAEQLRPRLGLDLRDCLFPAASDERVAAESLAQTALTQPALFVVEYAMARLWMSWGLQPTAMLGHSVGEYVAACLAGVFSLEDALDLIAERGRLMQALPTGAMTAVALAESALPPEVLAQGCSLAAVNAEGLCVLAGPLACIAAAEQLLQARGVAVRRLQVSHAFHSAMVEPALPAFEAVLARVTLHPPRLPFISNLSGRFITAEEATSPAYWVRHLRGTVRFADGLDSLLATPGRLLLEVGPGEVLTGLARRHARAGEAAALLASQPHPREQAQAEAHLAGTLARLWQAGAPLDWAACRSAEARPRRVPLPGYPFERQRHWVEAGPVASMAPVTAGPRPLDDWFEVMRWQRAEPVSASVARTAGPVLLLGQHSGFDETLAAMLSAAGHAVQRVTAFEGDADALAGLLQHAAAAHGPLQHIVHTGSLPAADDAQDEAVLQNGLYSLLALVRALHRAGPAVRAAKLRVTVLASQLDDITGIEPLHPAKAALRGPCAALPQEWPDIECQLIDALDPAGDGRAQAQLAAQVLAELQSPAALPQLALRGPHRWVQQAVAVSRPKAAPPLRRGGVYLVTGGLGGVGLALATHLARHWQARLVLLGRSALPAQGDWPALLADPATPAALRQRLQALAALAGEGGEWLALQADVSDAAQLRSALQAARRRFGTVHGVIHAAGLAGGGVMAQRDPEAVAAVMAPKLGGARALAQAWDGPAPDFVAHCSSMAAMVGAFGDADYAAANACLDAHAQWLRRERGWPAWSLLWDSWREVGMAAHRHLDVATSLSPAQGAEAFERVLAGPPAAVLVSPQGLAAKQAAARSLDFGDALPVATPRGSASHARPALAAPFAAPEGELEQALAALWGETLGFHGLGRRDSLFELGGDSLTALQLLTQVRQRFGVTLHPAELFTEPTVAGLAALVELRLIEQIGADLS